MKVREINISPDINIGGGNNIVFFAGPCVIESYEHTMAMADLLKKKFLEYEIPFVFKSSFDKANRSTVDSYRGPGIEEGLKILLEVKKKYDLPIITDVHDIKQVEKVAEIADVIQIPAFLCRQTDLLVEAGKTGKPVNIKKGQFMAPWNMMGLVNKVRTTKNNNIMLTERGTTFGYNNLVVDMRALPIMRATGFPVIIDATHSLQLPGGQGDCTGGMAEYIPEIVRSSIASGVDGVFMEIHDDVKKALCDGPNMLAYSRLDKILDQVKKIQSVCDWR